MKEVRQERDEIVTGRRSIRSSAPFILSGLSTAHGVFHWITQSFLVMLPEVKETFGLSPLQVGSITSIREAVGGVVSIPGGVLADVLRRYWGLVLAICMTGFGLPHPCTILSLYS